MSKFLIVWLSLIGNALGQCLVPIDVTLDSTELATEPEYIFQGCTGSFFQLEVHPNQTVENFTSYEFSIFEQNMLLFQMIDEWPLENSVYLATHGSFVNITASTDDISNFPISVHILEVQFQPKNETIDAGSLTVTDTLSIFSTANDPTTYDFTMDGAGTQLFDVTFRPNSLSNGFLAMTTGNGRISLVASRKPVSLAVEAEGQVTFDVVSQNVASAFQNMSTQIRYSIGHDMPTSSTPPPTTTPAPGIMAEAQIYILEINVEHFVNNYIEQIMTDVMSLSTNSSCTVIVSAASDCRRLCALTDDPDRGCVTFSTEVRFSYLCNIKNSDILISALEKMASNWKRDFQLNRIEFNDCLKSAQIQWIPFAVGIPLIALAVVAVAATMRKFVNLRREERTRQYRPMLDDTEDPHDSKLHRRLRGQQQFEFVE